MEKELMAVAMFVLGLLISVIGYFLKRAFSLLDTHDKQIEDIRMNCGQCNSKITEALLDKFSKLIDEKLDAWWAKVENGLMKEERLPPRGRKVTGDK